MNTNIKRCRRCGKLFNSYGTDSCPDCVEEMDRIFNEVQDYIYEHENATVVEISRALDIDGKVILDFIRDGSITLNEGSYAVYCEKVPQRPISSGRYCDDCKASLSKMFKSVASNADQQEEPQKKKIRMHIDLDR